MADELVKIAEDSARGSFFLISGTALATVIMAVASILVGRFLGPDLYGQYTLAFLIPQLLYLFADLGIGQGVTKFAAGLNAKGELNRLTKMLKYALILRAAVGIALFIINYAFADLLASTVLNSAELAFYVRLASVSILFQVIFSTATSAFVGLDKTEYNVLATNIHALAKSILSIALVLLGLGVAGAITGHVASYIIAAAVGAFILFIVLRKKQDPKNDQNAKDDLKTLMKYGAPLYISLLLSGFISFYQGFMLAIFTTTADVGNYKAATNFATLLSVVSIPITTALLPAFAKLDSSTDQKIKRFFKLANKYTAALVLPITVLIIMYSTQIVQIIYGLEYQTAPQFLATYCLIYLLVGLGYLTLTSFFNGLGETKTTLIISLIGFVILAVLSPILTRAYSVQGSIIAILIASTAGIAYGSYRARRKFHIEFDTRSLVKIYLVSAISSVPPLLLTLFAHLSRITDLGVGALLYLFTYITLAPMTKIVTASELQMITQVTKKTRLLALIATPIIRYQQWVLSTTRETLIVIVKAAVVGATALVLFWQDLTIIFTDALHSEVTSYVLVIPFLLAYLFYRKRKMIKAAVPLEPSKLWKKIPFNEVVGALLFLASLLLYWYGSYTFTPLEYHMLALPIFVSACVLILFNMQTLRQILFPIVFLFLLVPPPAEILYYVGSLLSSFSSDLSYNLLKILSIPVSLSTIDGIPTITVTQPDGTIIPLQVDIACSGIYSQIGFFIFALFIAYIIRDKLWKKGAMFLLGFPLIYMLNVLRIAIIGILGYYYGEDLALNMFHLFGGWVLIFLGTFMLLVISEKLFKTRITPRPTPKCPECSPQPRTANDFCLACGKIQNIHFNKIRKKDLAKVSALILSVILVMSIQTPVFALTEGPAEIITQTATGGNATTALLPQLNEYILHYLGRDEAFEQRAQQDASLIYLYEPENESGYWIWVTVEIASARSSLHRWETCLITWPLTHGEQPTVNQIDLRDILLLQNPPIIGRYFAFNYTDTNETQAVLYWFETSVFRINSTVQTKQVKISVIAYPNSIREVPAIEGELLAVATRITEHWGSIKTWSQTALLLSHNGDKLFILTMIFLVVIVLLYALDKRKEKKQNNIAYGKLSKANKQIIDAVRQAEKQKPPTLNTILQAFANITGQTTSKEELIQRLSDAEKTGIVERKIANIEDEPVQAWKTEIAFPEKRKPIDILRSLIPTRLKLKR
jgi:exosortase